MKAPYLSSRATALIASNSPHTFVGWTNLSIARLASVCGTAVTDYYRHIEGLDHIDHDAHSLSHPVSSEDFVPGAYLGRWCPKKMLSVHS